MLVAPAFRREQFMETTGFTAPVTLQGWAIPRGVGATVMCTRAAPPPAPCHELQPLVATSVTGASVREVRVAELKAARSARMKAMWADPAFRERMTRLRRSEREVRQRCEEPLTFAQASEPLTLGEATEPLGLKEAKAASVDENRSKRMKALWADSAFRERMSKVERKFSDEERAARSERMRSLWASQTWRESRKDGTEMVRKHSEAALRRWSDPAYRARMAAARKGRVAHNKGVSPSKLTRLRMSLARRGVPKSAETRRRMSVARRSPSEARDSWRAHISQSKRGKTREYLMMRRELRALHKDLKLWSELYRARHGQIPDSETALGVVAPMMAVRIRRYLTLREAIGADEKKTLESKIIA